MSLTFTVLFLTGFALAWIVALVCLHRAQTRLINAMEERNKLLLSK